MLQFLFSAVQIPWTNILISVGVIAALVLVLKLLKTTFKKALKFVLNAVIGCAILYVVSMIPAANFAVQWWHALLTGLFGIPAAVILVVVYLVV